jgi:hypothetical protein
MIDNLQNLQQSFQRKGESETHGTRNQIKKTCRNRMKQFTQFLAATAQFSAVLYTGL